MLQYSLVLSRAHHALQSEYIERGIVWPANGSSLDVFAIQQLFGHILCAIYFSGGSGQCPHETIPSTCALTCNGICMRN
jgi:hypothetical protein